MATLEDFGQELIEKVEDCRSGKGAEFEEILLQQVFDVLEEEGVQDDPTHCYLRRDDMYSDPAELELLVNGYDLRDEGTTLELFAVLAYPDQPRARVSAMDANSHLRALQNVYERSKSGLAEDLTGQDAESLARQIESLANLREVILTLVTNGEVQSCDLHPTKSGGVSIRRKVLDLRGIQRLQQPDQIIVDFASKDQHGLPCVQLPQENGALRSYLAILPGSLLADLYARHGQRMLEANVRSFLKSSTRVNSGIIKTVANEPHMFFAYNNGITATAENLDVHTEADGLRIFRCRNLQIVNGGQTTASIYHARRTGKKLEQVFIPMKINEVLDKSKAEEIVQNISKYANSQNAVKMADLAANRSFHVELHRLSQEQVPAGPFTNGTVASQWFYERMRGQYDNELGRQTTAARKRQFRAKFPSAQCITKTDAARYMMIWERQPHVVGTGAEKNYKVFEDRYIVEKKLNPNAEWFQELIGRAIIVDACDRLVRDTRIPGYKANIVAYTVALLAERYRDHINLKKVWNEQRAPKKVTDWMVAAIPHVRQHLVEPEVSGSNVTEWAKKPRCWDRLLVADFNIPW